MRQRLNAAALVAASEPRSLQADARSLLFFAETNSHFVQSESFKFEWMVV